MLVPSLQQTQFEADDYNMFRRKDDVMYSAPNFPNNNVLYPPTFQNYKLIRKNNYPIYTTDNWRKPNILFRPPNVMYPLQHNTRNYVLPNHNIKHINPYYVW